MNSMAWKELVEKIGVGNVVGLNEMEVVGLEESGEYWPESLAIILKKSVVLSAIGIETGKQLADLAFVVKKEKIRDLMMSLGTLAQ